MGLIPIPCPHCGYDLRMQLHDQGARCPECGLYSTRSEIVSPPDTGSVVFEPRHRMRGLYIPSGIVLAVFGGVLFTQNYGGEGARSVLLSLLLLVAVAAIAGAGMVGFFAGQQAAVKLPPGERLTFAFACAARTMFLNVIIVSVLAFVTAIGIGIVRTILGV